MNPKPPTDKQVLAYFKTFDPPSQMRSCTYCGREGQGYYVQPVHPFYVTASPEYHLPEILRVPFELGSLNVFCCTECHNAKYAERKARRKQQLKQEPRCEVCTARGSWQLGTHLLCGKHKRAVIGKVSSTIAQSGLGGLAMFGNIGQRDLLESEIHSLKGGAA